MTGISLGLSARSGDRITDVPGITVGHHHRIDADATVADPADPQLPGRGWATGTTVVTVPDGSVTAVDVRGGAPGTRETDLLDPAATVRSAHAIVLTGGSAYGLAAADGVMTGLEEAGRGLAMDEAGHRVPIVPAAVIFDLPVGQWSARPDAGFGAAALAAATRDGATGEFAVGSVGAGAGARAGSLKGGVGTAATRLGPDGPVVGALLVVNPVGSVIDPETGLPWPGVTSAHELGTPTPAEVETLAALAAKATALNTIIGVVATDAVLDPAGARRLAITAHDGLARAVRPVHTPLDGDTIFAVATGTATGATDPDSPTVPEGMTQDAPLQAALGAAAADVVARAVVDAVISARSVAGIPAYRDVLPSVFAD